MNLATYLTVNRMSRRDVDNLARVFGVTTFKLG